MQNVLNEKQVFSISVFLLLYFSFLFLNFTYFNLDFVLIGVFQELLTLPAMLVTLVLFVLLVVATFKKQYTLQNYIYGSMVILFAILTSIVISFN